MEEYKPVYLDSIAYENAETNPTLNPIIFLHGLMCSKEHWGFIPEVVTVKSHRKVYTYDARNHGKSGYSDESNFDLNVRDLFHFMDQMRIRKAVLIGASMGGKTAIHAALRRPDRVEMIFSLDMFVKKMSPELIYEVIGFMRTWTETVRWHPMNVHEENIHESTVESVYQRLPVNPITEKEKRTLLRSKFVYKKRPNGGFEPDYNSDALLRALENHVTETQEASGQFEGPAYFLYATESVLDVLSDEENIRAHFPRYEMIEFKNSTHHIHLDFPDRLCDVIITRLFATGV